MKNSKLLRSLGLGLAIFAALIVYAYGFKVTKVNLDETKSERRQTQLFRILRALAKPEIIEYDKEEVSIETPFFMPCPEGGFQPPDIDKSGAYLLLDKNCAEPGETVRVEGYNFEPNISGPINFLPPSGVVLGLGRMQTDAEGFFSLEVKLPKRPETVEQKIQTISRKNVGPPNLTRSALDTWDKIIETVFLALLATTLATLLAVPLSFFAARNIMSDVTSPILVIAFNLIAIPIGLFFGGKAAGLLKSLSDFLAVNTIVVFIVVIVGASLAYFIFKKSVPQEENVLPTKSEKTIQYIGMFVSSLLGILTIFMLSKLMILIGDRLVIALGSFGFLGKFIADIGDIIGMAFTAVTALVVAGILSSMGGKLGNWVLKKYNLSVLKILGVLFITMAGSIWALVIMAGINWVYEINDPLVLITIPAIVGALMGGFAGVYYKPKAAVPIGMVVYFLTRTIFNVLRSIEALVMAIVFVVWVGIGPFAGSLALALHTIAALAKLYSEQVESIIAGPIEAVSATGANRLQTIVYAVIPQIIPPYISFTMYRWDINVRMSTIIGFAGGGGIGFLLQQNINLLNYRAASVQMLAIAIVVASMDYLSSKIREKIV
jgi:phosphonate ABC transporter permease subunit PhnE